MTLQAGRPSTKKTAKEKAIEDVQEIEKPKTVRFNANIPKELHRKLKMKAASEDLQLTELAIKAFEEYLSK